MDINLYVKSHIFKSSDAAYKLASNNKDVTFARNLISKKISKITNSTNSINFHKLTKYHKYMDKLNFILPPERYFSYNLPTKTQTVKS